MTLQHTPTVTGREITHTLRRQEGLALQRQLKVILKSLSRYMQNASRIKRFDHEIRRLYISYIYINICSRVCI